MVDFKIELHDDGIQDLLKSADVQSYLELEAQAMARRFGGDAEVDVYVGATRANASVTVRLDDNMNNELLKAMT